MAADANISTRGMAWFLVAGGFAVGLSYFLYSVDNYLTYSDKEQKLGRTLHELRTAQSEVSPGVSDQRQMPIALTQVQDSAPAHDAPAHDAPAHDAPAHDAPAHDATAHDATAHDDHSDH